ncbi:exported protein of unknown function [Sterolibacterium denitrificans]|uniref:Serine/threonine protein kinase n=1 Tax=Sterolibacterium denitrificans TaxID=157592 RepID=A0A7Z7HSB1_9PROT|nr:hypothetical protein [Sterolibacterium denitrificans]SMB24745.1 exported protein of unknown function [Sterolibacterium denitrificans]
MNHSMKRGLAFSFCLAGAMMVAGATNAAPTDTAQPEVMAGKSKPPAKTSIRGTDTPRKAAGHSAPGSDRTFNPQPELPDRKAKGAGYNMPGSDRSFNPQPELPDRPASAAQSN